MERDKKVNTTLYAMGWKVLRFWDVEINKHLNECILAVKQAVMEAVKEKQIQR